MEYDLAAVTELLTEALSPKELSVVTYDFSPRKGLEDIGFGVESHSQRAFELVQFAARRDLIPELLDIVKERNPYQFSKFENKLVSKEDSSQNIDLGEIVVRGLGLINQSNRQFAFDNIQQNIFNTGKVDIKIGAKGLNNPYVVGNPIQPDNVKVFLGRYDVARTIIQEIKKPGQKPSILLYGRRRMGKTSALLNIPRLVRDRDVITVYVSAQSVKFHTNIDFCYYLVQAIYKELKKSGIITDTLNSFLNKTTFNINPVLVLSEFFEITNNLLEEAEKTCLVSIDEYEEIDIHIDIGTNTDTEEGFKQDQHISRELLLELRETLQHKTQFAFLFAGIHFLNDLAKVNWSEIFINVKTIHISFLSRLESYKLLTKPVPEMTYESEQLIEKILDVTGCQPFLLQAVASEIVNILNSLDSVSVTQDILAEALDLVLNRNNTYFDYIWDTESKDNGEKHLLKLVASQYNGLNRNSLSPDSKELRNLIRKEVLKIEGEFIKLTMPIVASWLRKNQHIL